MTRRKNMTKGERQLALENNIQQLQMSTRMGQMLVQQIGSSVSSMARDFNELTGRQRDAQYRLLAIQQLLNLDVEIINKLSEEMQVKDFEEASLREDTQTGAFSVDMVDETSSILITSKTPEGGGILRSRVALAELGFPDLRQNLIGKKVGDSVEADLNNTKHTITILGIRNLPQVLTTEDKPELVTLPVPDTANPQQEVLIQI